MNDKKASKAIHISELGPMIEELAREIIKRRDARKAAKKAATK